MDYITLVSMLGLAAFIHASFQVSVSSLTMMSGHTLGKIKNRDKLNRLMFGFIVGVTVITILLLAFFMYIFSIFLVAGQVPVLLWSVVCGYLVGVGFCMILFYFQKNKGTSLWIPRHFADFLAARSQKTNRASEAFSLGVSSVLAEILFVAAPISLAALILLSFSWQEQLGLGLLYALVSIIFLLVMYFLVNRGVKISRIQQWRENNKWFIQYIAGSALLVLGAYIYVNEILNNEFFL